MPKLDSFTFFTKDYLVFIFGGDRCGLCSNDFYVIDIEEPVTGNEGIVTKIDYEIEENERVERERQLLEQDDLARKNNSMNANNLSDSRNKTGHNFAPEPELIDSPTKKVDRSPKRMPTKVGNSAMKKQGSDQKLKDNFPSPTKKQLTINEQRMNAMQDPNYSKQSNRKNTDSPTNRGKGSEQNLDIDQNDIEIN